jgi:hypothetical protein
LNWESGGCETGALKIKKKNGISTSNHFEEKDFTCMNYEKGGFHPV